MPYSPMFERWRVDLDGHRYDILLDLGRGESYPLRSHPWFFGVRIPMADRKEDGTPPHTELIRLNAVENRIREFARARDGMYVGRRTGDGNRDLMFYFEVRPRGLEDRIRASVGLEILFISRADPRWQGYEQLLPSERDWRQIEDLKIVDALINADANPELAHRIEHVVETSSAKGAEALAKLFTKLELDDVTIDSEGPAITVSGIQIARLEDIEAITRVSFILENKAPKARGDYKGWTSNPEIEGEVDLDGDYEGDEGPDVQALINALTQAATADADGAEG